MVEQELFKLPLWSDGDVSLVESLLKGSGFWFAKNDGFGECPAELLVRPKDLPAVKEFLAAYRVSHADGTTGPIPW